ncbi:hypothetical protein MAHJHV53_46990 [Mycobacterium avium subsp. hominissuis]|uniref:Transposase n=1 Tax=Mycobacterium paraffinicum TaxID=53378 RepID=A0ABP8RDC9_9MYCO|nr:hypothetical protein MAH_p42 [Mycobacterium avium subsp. hominissuis TH135]
MAGSRSSRQRIRRYLGWRVAELLRRRRAASQPSQIFTLDYTQCGYGATGGSDQNTLRTRANAFRNCAEVWALAKHFGVCSTAICRIKHGIQRDDTLAAN